MTPSTFFQHWGIAENPFRGEEARQDSVFSRLTEADQRTPGSAVAMPGSGASEVPYRSALAAAAQHAELEKFVGDFGRISSSVVFGEKGSGKTAMRLQIAHQATLHNARFPDAKVLLVANDDLNLMLERFHGRARRVTRKGETTPTESFKQIKLADHIDAIMGRVVPRVIDLVLAGTPEAESSETKPAGSGGAVDSERLELGADPKRVLKRTDIAVRRDLLALAAAYDRAEEGASRIRPLRWAMGVRRPWVEQLWTGLAYFGWIPPLVLAIFMASVPRGAFSPQPMISTPAVVAAGGPVVSNAGSAVSQAVPAPTTPDPASTAEAVAGSGVLPGGAAPVISGGAASSGQAFWQSVKHWPDWFGLTGGGDPRVVVWTTAFVLSLLLWIAFLIKRVWTDRFRLGRQAGRLYRQVRVTGRSEWSFVQAVRALPAFMRTSAFLPTSDSEDLRLRMIDRLRRVLRLFGYRGVVVVVDRVDEPIIISGDPERMKLVVWPMLTSKFLQQEGLGIKLLLPIELRHMLFRESAAFFQQARLDKQNLVEQLGWTGSTLFDLCNARLTACRGISVGEGGKQMVSLTDLFDEDVGRQGIVEALEAMRHPRDAFKMLYRCVVEHCASATEDQGLWTIPRRVLEGVLKGEMERVRQLAMGVRP